MDTQCQRSYVGKTKYPLNKRNLQSNGSFPLFSILGTEGVAFHPLWINRKDSLWLQFERIEGLGVSGTTLFKTLIIG